MKSGGETCIAAMLKLKQKTEQYLFTISIGR